MKNDLIGCLLLIMFESNVEKLPFSASVLERPFILRLVPAPSFCQPQAKAKAKAMTGMLYIHTKE